MTLCLSLDDVIAAGREAGLAAPPLSQAQADYAAAILASYAGLLAAITDVPRPGTCSVAAGDAAAPHAPGNLATAGPGRTEQDAA